MCRPPPAASPTESLLCTRSGKVQVAERPGPEARSEGPPPQPSRQLGIGGRGAAPHLCPALGKALGFWRGNPQAQPGCEGREERKGKGASPRRSRAGWRGGQSQAGPGPHREQPDSSGSVSEVRTGLLPSGSSGRNPRPGVGLRTLQTRTSRDPGRPHRRALVLPSGFVARRSRKAGPGEGSRPAACAGTSGAWRPHPPPARKEGSRQRLVSTVYTLFQTTGF